MDIICDIDGTVADLTHRRHWIETKPKNWKAFFQGIEQDKPIDSVIEVIRSLYFDQHDIIFCSGRSSDYRDVTKAWLREHVGGWAGASPLYMRAIGDFRADDIVKEELLAQIRVNGYEPKIAFDDRDRVVSMWRRNGIQCFQVAEGNF